MMWEKVKSIKNYDVIKFLNANILFSLSTYLVNLIVPYFIAINLLADYSATYQVLILVVFALDFGISTSFIRHRSLDKIFIPIFSISQLLIFGIIIMLFLVGESFLHIIGLSNINISLELFFLAVLSQLVWLFLRNWLLAEKKFRILNYHTLVVFIARLILLIVFISINGTLDTLIIFFFILPFIFAVIHLAYLNLSSLKLIGDNHTLLIKYIKEFLLFSSLTYISTVLFLLATRLIFIIFAGKNDIFLAELGYPFFFIGIFNVFYYSFRNYFISKFDLNSIENIKLYWIRLRKNYIFNIIAIVTISSLISFVIFLIKPAYLSFSAVIYSFIVICSTAFVSYLGMFTLLSKTFNYNKFEVLINLSRLVISFIIIYYAFAQSMIQGLVLLFSAHVFMEFIFFIYVRNRVARLI